MAFFVDNCNLFDEFLTLAAGGGEPPKAVTVDGPLGPDDALLIIDMQKDFIPYHPHNNPFGGKFGVAEGQAVVEPIAWLIEQAVTAQATIVASRDYHPVDHVSFMEEGGPFPTHCVQGTRGAELNERIAEALAAGRNALQERVQIGFKAFHEDIDSFGALPYQDGKVYTNGGEGRIQRREPGKKAPRFLVGCQSSPWTGCCILKQSALMGPTERCTVGADHMNSPPDLLAIHGDGKDRGKKSLQDILQNAKRIFVCGLALDFCVSDTCINAKALGVQAEVYMLLDLARAAHIPGVGNFGTGFLQDPKQVLGNLEKAGVKLASIRGVSKLEVPAGLTARGGQEADQNDFPSALNPMGLSHLSIEVDVNQAENQYTVCTKSASDWKLRFLKLARGSVSGKLSPEADLPKGWPNAPPGAKKLRWAYPTNLISALQQDKDAKATFAFLSMKASPELQFVSYGGFLLLSESGKVLAVQQLAKGSALSFEKPREAQGTEAGLREAGRLQSITLPALRRHASKDFCWLLPNETLQLGTEKWRVPSSGAFLYTWEAPGREPVVFALKGFA